MPQIMLKASCTDIALTVCSNFKGTNGRLSKMKSSVRVTEAERGRNQSHMGYVTPDCPALKHYVR